MELYDTTASAMSRLLTRRYSTSFSSATRMFPGDIQFHIYNAYGLVRIADEIVDTYKADDTLELLDDLELETYAALARGFSTNPVVHAFQLSANQNSIGKDLIEPFFASMRMDITKLSYDHDEYVAYIHGSAEVIGLMCLKIFCRGDNIKYQKLESGAASLGSAFQKINFLRDLAADHNELGRFYFPNMSFEAFDEASKSIIIADIQSDMSAALPYIRQLPSDARRAVMTSYRYYNALLDKLNRTAATQIKQTRIRIPNYRKTLILASSYMKDKV